MRIAALLPVVLVAAGTVAGTALADEVKLVTGETLKGTIVSRDDGGVVLDHPVLGRLTIGRTQIEPPAPPPPPPPAWKFRAELGASGSSGNTDQSDLHAAVSALHEDETSRFKAGAGWATSENDGDETKDQKYAEAIYDWKFRDSPWSAFATGRVDWDEFQDWDRRATVGAGAGLSLVDEATVKLRVRAGLATTREWGGSDPDREDWRLEGLIGAEASWQINERTAIEAKSTWYPDLDDGGEHRVVSSAAWTVKLAEAAALSLKLGIEHEYDSHNEDPFETSDFRWFAALLFEF